MAEPHDNDSESPPVTGELLARLLARHELAAARHRSAVARKLGVAEGEMLAIAHLAACDGMTATQLAELLDLSSGGITALLQRLERGEHIVRGPHPSDGRSAIVRLAPATAKRVAAASERFVAELDRLAAELAEPQRAAVAAFLAGVAATSSGEAEHAWKIAAPVSGAPAEPVPSLWM